MPCGPRFDGKFWVFFCIYGGGGGQLVSETPEPLRNTANGLFQWKNLFTFPRVEKIDRRIL